MRCGATACALILGLPFRLIAAEAPIGPPPPPLPISAAESEWPQALEAILAAWVEASREFGPVEAQFERFVYDEMFETERRATGTYSYERPFVFRLEGRPVEVAEGSPSAMKGRGGKPYQIVPDLATAWIADGMRIKSADLIDGAWVDGDAKELPGGSVEAGHLQGESSFLWIKTKWRIDGSWLPLVVGVTREDASDRFHWTLEKAENEQLFLLHAVPRDRGDAAWYGAIDVLLDRRSYRTRAIRIHDQAGTKQTVYSFTEWRTKRTAERD
ncbi:MAG: hypothetical protein WED34_12450 [Planctomycetales bacterium]